MKGIKRYKLPVLRQISPGGVTYTHGKIVNNTARSLHGDKMVTKLIVVFIS